SFPVPSMSALPSTAKSGFGDAGTGFVGSQDGLLPDKDSACAASAGSGSGSGSGSTDAFAWWSGGQTVKAEVARRRSCSSLATSFSVSLDGLSNQSVDHTRTSCQPKLLSTSSRRRSRSRALLLEWYAAPSHSTPAR